MAKYRLTPEHRAQLKPWAARWVDTAMSTAAMTEDDKAVCQEAVIGLYAAANLPPPKAIVFVPSPFVMTFAGGFAAALWYKHRYGKFPDKDIVDYAARIAATDEGNSKDIAVRNRKAASAIRYSTLSATQQAVKKAIHYGYNTPMDSALASNRDGMRQAIRHFPYLPRLSLDVIATHPITQEQVWRSTAQSARIASRTATREATWTAVLNATRPNVLDFNEAARTATWDDTYDVYKNWYVVGCDMKKLADDLGIGEFGIRCAQNTWRMEQGGNQWVGDDAYVSFFQDIVGLDLPEYKLYQHWRTLAERSGPRIVHRDFCMISDRPDTFLLDEQNRPHNDNGPFLRWRDGSALYAIHGVHIPAWVFEQPEWLTTSTIRSQNNTEVQRIMIERYGWDRYVADLGGKVVDHDERWGTLLDTSGGLVLKVINRSPEPDGSFRQYVLPVADRCQPLPDTPNGRLGRPQKKTALNAVASTFGMTGKQYAALLGAES